jgi:hypothetical protein
MLLIVFDPLDRNTIGSTKSSEMAKPLEERSDEDLQRGLAEGEFGEKKAAVAQEILRRRQEAKAQDLRRKYTWFGSILAALSLTLMALRRFWRKTVA